jgi:hypothetical protein
MEGRGYSQWRRVIVDSHNFDEQQEPDLDPLLSEESNPDPHLSKKTDSVMRIRNLA